MSRVVAPARRLAAVLLTAALAACAAPGGQDLVPSADDVGAPNGALARVGKAGAPPPAARPLVQPATLVGLSADEVTTLLGAPVMRRRDAGAEMWQYRSNSCVLDVFIYGDGEAPRVRYAQVRGRAGHDCAGQAFTLDI